MKDISISDLGILLLQIFSTTLLFILLSTNLNAEGTVQLNPNGIAGDPCVNPNIDVGDLAMVRLYEVNVNFPQFAGFGSRGTTNSICFTVKDPKEVVYIALSSAAGNGGECNPTTFDWRIAGPSGVAHGPFTQSQATANGNDFGPVMSGPDVFNAGGYSTAGMYTFQPTEAGEYCLEIDNYTGITYLRNFDITVADCPGAAGTVIPGRLFSQNWAIRTPCVSSIINCTNDPAVSGQFAGFQPFQNPFEGAIYVLTDDNFVQEVDFDSGGAFGTGFRGLTFSLSFNITGPGNTGDVLADRQSKDGSNQTFANPDLFDVYLNPPDPNCYEEGICGEIIFGPILDCALPLCIAYEVTQPGLVELFVDIDGPDGVFTPNSADVFLAERAVSLVDLVGCIPWDGLDGLGNPVTLSDNFDILGSYSQGETHFMMYDVENNNPGWQIDIIDPPCAEPNFNLFWDDSLLNPADNDPGVVQDLVSLTGTPQPAHIWEDQEEASALGFGESNTINTWFFSSINEVIAVSSCQPMIDIVKDGIYQDENDDGLAQVGETIAYTFVVANTGNTDLIDITVTDPLVTVSGGPISLGIGEIDNTTFTGVYVLTQMDIDNMMVENTATVAGEDPVSGDIVMDTSSDNEMLPQLSEIVLTKTASDAGLGTPPLPGDIINYTFEVCNTGNTTLTNVMVTDPLVTVMGAPIASLAPGACDNVSYTGTYAITSDDIAAEEVANTAMTVGTDPKGNMVTDTDEELVTLELAPMIMLTKTADDSNVNDPAVAGDIIIYAFEICNTGNVDLTMVTLTDPLVTISGGPIAMLAVGDCDNVTFSGMYPITTDDINNGMVANTATTNGTDPNGTVVMDDDPANVPLVQDPMIDIIKNGSFNDENGDGLAQVGESITYIFVVENTGNVTLTNVTVTDPLVTVSGGPIPILIPGEMDMTTFTGTYILTQADVDNGMVNNTATVTGDDPNGDSVMDTDPETTPFAQDPEIMLIKEGTFQDENGDAIAQVGETISYVFTVMNIGNVTLTNVTVTDPLITVSGGPIPILIPLASDNTTFTGSYTLTQADIDNGTVDNVATTSGTDPNGDPVMDDDPEMEPLPILPAIDLVKEGTFQDENGDGITQVGETIAYTFTVMNTGNVTLSNVVVTDPLVTVSGGPIPTLAVGASDNTTFTGTYVITQADIDNGMVENTATTTGMDPNGDTVEDMDPEEEPLPQEPMIDLVKEGSFQDENGDGIAQVGEIITYTFTVMNTGNVTLTNVMITDPIVTVMGGPVPSLAVGASDNTTFTGTYILTQSDIDNGTVDNVATTMGSDPNGDPVMDDDPHMEPLPQDPMIDLLKSGEFQDENGDGISQVGETIAYTFTISNTGNVTLTNVMVTDPLVTVIGGPLASLAVGATDNTTFTGTYTLTQDDIDAGNVANVATTTGTDPNGDPVTDDDPEDIPTPQEPMIDIIKDGTFQDENGDNIAQVGETISYVFTVTNTGNVTLTNVTVTDPLVTVSGGPIPSLAVGDSDNTTFSGTYVLTQDDIDAGNVENVATTEGDDPSGDPVMDDDPEDVPPPQDPMIDIIKSGVFQDENGDGLAQAGETISYSFVVTNTGNVTLTGVTVTDPLVTVSGGPITLAPGAVDNTTFTGTYTLTQEDVDAAMVINLATTTGNDPNGDPVNDNDPEETPYTQDPDITLAKEGTFQDENADGIAQVGESISYVFTVMNTGNVTLTNVTVTDPLVTVIGGPIAILTVGSTDNTTFTGTYTLTQADIDAGNVENVATTTGTDPNGDPVMDDDPNDEPLPQDPMIDLIKSGVFQDENGDGISQVGETIAYTFEISNIGNVTLTNVTVTDPLVTVMGGPIPSLAVGATDNTTFTGTYVLTQDDINNGSVTNIATTSGTDPNGDPVMDDDPEEVPTPQDPMLDLIKDGTFQDENGDGAAQVGETISYIFTVTNTGNVTLTNVTISDPLVTVIGGPIPSLSVGAIDNITFSGMYTLTQDDIDNGMVDNVATATGTDPNGDPVTDDDPEMEPIPQNPMIDLVKSGVFQDENGDGLAQAGESISYIFIVTNTGNVTLTNVTVTDPLVTVSGGPITLIPGQVDNATFTGTYILTQDDVDAAMVMNVATTMGTDPNGVPVSDDDPEETLYTQDPNITLLKEGEFQDENGDGVSQVGETITYTFTVINTGNVTLTNVTVTDPLVTVMGGPIPTFLVGSTDNTTFTGVYTLTQDDIDAGNVENVATTTGTDPNGDPVTDDDPEDILTPQDPMIDLIKSGEFQDENGDGISQVGETISYTFTVSNTGNVTLTNVTVTDPLVTVMGGPLPSLPVGAIDNATFTGTYTLTLMDINNGGVANVATTTGTDPSGDPVMDDDPDDVPTPQDPMIDLVKTGVFQDENGDNIAQVGESITYTFIVTNTGNVTITNIVITDPLVTVMGGPIPSLDPSQIDDVTFTGIYMLTQDDIDSGSLENVATTTGEDPNGDPVTDDDPEETPTPQDPMIELQKSGSFNDENGDGVAQQGETISYVFIVMNTGNVTLTDVTVMDPIVTVIGGPLATLAVGASDNMTFTGTYALTQTDVDNGSVDNVATASGTDPNGDPVMDEDPENTPFIQDPEIMLLKSGMFQDENGDGISQVGETISYQFTITNTGNVTLTNITVTDPIVTVVGGPIPILGVGMSDNTTFTGSYILTQDDIDAGEVLNLATTSGEDPDGNPVIDEDPDDNPAPQAPMIDLIKNSVFVDENGDGISQVGETITYTFIVTNTGNVTVTDIVITDPLITVIGGPIATLAVGAVDNTTFTGVYTLTQGDIDNGSVDNVATATGNDPDGNPVSDNDPENTPTPQDPAIELVKTGTFQDENGDGFAQVGETITYAFSVMNTGNVSLMNVTIVDPIVTVTGGPIPLLPVGATDNTTFSGTYTLTQADINTGGVVNIAVTNATDPNGDPVTDDDMEEIPTPQNPMIDIIKSGVFNDESGDGIPQIGETLTYIFIVTNTGNVTLTNITVTDPIVTVTGGPIPVLAPGMSDNTTFSGIYVLSQIDIDNASVMNTATVTGDDPNGNPVTDDGPEDTPFTQDPEILLVKTGSFEDENGDGIAQVGETITYTFGVTNTGNVTLTNVIVTDPIVTIMGGPIPTLGVGQTDNDTFTGIYTLTLDDINAGEVLNTATTTGNDPNGDPVSDPDDEDILIPQSPGIDIIKSGTYQDDGVLPGIAEVGETIVYQFTVTNTGNVSLTNVTVTDPLVTVMGGPLATLLPGVIDNTTFTGVYTLTQADIDAGGVPNVATVTGTDPNGAPPITDNDPEDTPVPQNPMIDIVKNGSFVDENGDGVAQVGESINYGFIVTNTGNVTLTNINVIDPIVTVQGGPIPVLGVGQSDNSTFSGIYILTQEDVDNGDVENTAIVTGDDPNGTPVTDDDMETTPFEQNPGLVIEKIGTLVDENQDGIAQVGETISYVFEVSNTGSVTLTNVTVSDPLVTVSGTAIPVLLPGQIDNTTFTGLYTLTQADIDNGNVANTATANGQDPDGNDVTDSSDEDVPTPQNPGIAIIKNGTLNDANGDGIPQVGESIIYTFIVSNTGNVTLTNVTVNDPLVTVSGGPIAILPVGATDNTTFTGVYQLTIADINNGSVENTATVSGDDPNGNPITDDDLEETPLTPSPNIELLKASSLNDENGNGFTDVGETISYVFTVINTGNTTLTNVTVTDPIVTVSGGPIALLNPGESDNTTFTGIYVITQADIDAGFIENIALTEGEDPNGDPVNDPSDDPNDPTDVDPDGDGDPDDPTVTTLNIQPCISLIKTSDLDLGANGFANAGDIITYTYVATNCGNVTLVNVTLSEDAGIFTGTGSLPISGPVVPSTLAPGQSGTATATYAITEADIAALGVDNQAVVIAQDPNGDDVTDLSDTGNPADPNETGGPDDPTYTAISLPPGNISGQVTNDIDNNFVGEEPLSNVLIVLITSEGDTLETFTDENGNYEFLNVPSGPFTLIETDPEDFFSVTDIDGGDPNVINGDLAPGEDKVNQDFVDGICDELVCNGDLQISLNVECELLLTPDQLLESPAPGDYDIMLFNENGDYIRDDTLTAAEAGETIRYQISCLGNSCWGEIIVEANIIPELSSPCACTEDGTIPAECTLWCSPSGTVPASLISPEEATAAFGQCGPDLIGEIQVTETREGDICSPDGEVVMLTYTGKVLLHGVIQQVDILCQKYTTLKLDITEEVFEFPRNVVLDCDYLSTINAEETNFMLGEPASIFAATGSGSLAYPNYMDSHDTILNIVTVLDTVLVEVGQEFRDTMVMEIINGEEVWTLITVVDKILEEQVVERLDTIGRTNPIVPIIDRVCNVLSGYSDVEFEACGEGRKIVRTWNLIDWCDTDVILSSVQTIEIIDLTAPTIDEDVITNITASIEPWSCTAKLLLPQLSINDNCDPNPTVEFITFEGSVEGDYLVDLWLDQSPILIEANVSDDCGNTSVIEFLVEVIDDVPPVPVCETSLQVSLTDTGSGGGAGQVFAIDLDEGSHDSGCGKITRTVVRLEDYSEIVRDCRGNVVGFAPTSCNPLTETIDLGAPIFKDDCDATGENLAEITLPGDFVKVCCEDVGQIVQVILFLEDEAGNVNQCLINIEVLDLSKPTLVCQDVTISCAEGDFLAPPAMVGDGCETESSHEVQLLSESRGNNVCSGGQTVREWFIDLDRSGDFSTGDAFCQQIVSVSSEGDFNPFTIKWPKSYDAKVVDGINIEFNDDNEIVEIPASIEMGDPFTCVPDQADEIPVWCDTECGLIGYSMESDTIAAGDACLKILRRWTVVDWCKFNANSTDIDDENDSSRDTFEAIEDWAQSDLNAPGCPDYAQDIGDPVYFRYSSVDEDGYYTYDQVLVVIDDNNPEIDSPETFVVNTSGGAETKDDVAQCVGSDDITATASDFCGGEITGTSRLQWQITVSVNDVIIASKTAVGAEATMNSQVGSPGDIHTITWTVKDGCGNTSSSSTTVTFSDQQAPTPFCVSGLTTAFMAADGTVTVWGAEFDFGSFDNCTDTDDLRFTLVRADEIPIRPGEAGFEDQTGITFHCSDFSSFEELDVYVWDLSGNGDFCSVGILLADNGNICPEQADQPEDGLGAQISGDITTSYGLDIPEVEVTINSNNLSEYPQASLTDDGGEYAFSNNPMDNNYQLSANKEEEYITGLSTLDLVQIQRHILDLASFDDPYKILAADADGNGAVSVTDIIQLRSIVLGNTEDLDNVSPWIFLDASQQFFDKQNPWPFTETISIRNLSENMLDQDFVGIKIGDVNESYLGSENRSTGLLSLQVENTILRKDGQIKIPIYSSNFSDVYGLQFTLDHQGLEFISLESGSIALTEDINIGRFATQTSVSWNEAEAMSVNNDEALFTITFAAVEDIELANVLELNDAVTKAEAYIGKDFSIHNIELNIIDDLALPELMQNTPNPFIEETTIGFNMPNSAFATLSIYDVDGKQLKIVDGMFVKGYNAISLDRRDISASGVVYYTLKTGEFSETKKMIVLD